MDREGGSSPRATGTVTALRPDSAGELRTPFSPGSIRTLREGGWKCEVPSRLGSGAGWNDEELVAAGAVITDDPGPRSADVVLCVEPPPASVVRMLGHGTVLMGLLQPFDSAELIAAARDAGVSAVAMELIPRSTIAQSMDALSSQASLAGYAAVIRGASRLRRVLPMMSTAAGTIPPARVLVIGTGVAGLQAIATAVRLGARVTAYDVRETAREQVESLGARFAKINIDGAAETQDGYAGVLADEQLAVQRAALGKLCHESDLIVTTAQVFGKPAPTILERDMLRGMKSGAVVVDLAISSGGNLDVSYDGMDEMIEGVRVLADARLHSAVACDASDMLSSNMAALLLHITDPQGHLQTDARDEIVRSVLVTHGGQVQGTAATPHAEGEAVSS